MKIIRYFTPEEARKTLPLVKRIVRDIINAGVAMRTLAATVEGDILDNSEIQNIATDINNYMQELEEIGCYYKDWNFTIGLVDFPSKIDDKDVMLCWRSDEEDIKFYHEIDEGYSNRKLIPGIYFYSKVS